MEAGLLPPCLFRRILSRVPGLRFSLIDSLSPSLPSAPASWQTAAAM
jgi:hypothetical protein